MYLPISEKHFYDYGIVFTSESTCDTLVRGLDQDFICVINDRPLKESESSEDEEESDDEDHNEGIQRMKAEKDGGSVSVTQKLFDKNEYCYINQTVCVGDSIYSHMTHSVDQGSRILILNKDTLETKQQINLGLEALMVLYKVNDQYMLGGGENGFLYVFDIVKNVVHAKLQIIQEEGISRNLDLLDIAKSPSPSDIE